MNTFFPGSSQPVTKRGIATSTWTFLPNIGPLCGLAKILSELYLSLRLFLLSPSFPLSFPSCQTCITV